MKEHQEFHFFEKKVKVIIDRPLYKLMDNYQNLGVEKLSQWFERCAEKECKGVSAFYYQLSKQMVMLIG